MLIRFLTIKNIILSFQYSIYRVNNMTWGVNGDSLGKEHLRYVSLNGTTKLYGFLLSGHSIVLALEESDLYIAGIKPYYKRVRTFRNFKDTDEGSGQEEKLREFFESGPTIRMAKKSMNNKFDTRSQCSIEDIKTFFDLESFSSYKLP